MGEESLSLTNSMIDHGTPVA